MGEAVEIIEGGEDILITCEHASQRMPDGWSWPEEDRWLIGTHWAYDIGARTLSLELAERLGASVVLSKFSRLLVDPNRPEDSPTLFRDHAEGRPILLNTRELDDAERKRRIERLLRPYHAALDEAVKTRRAPTLVAIHSFTPIYEGTPRELEVGVLFNHDEELATRLQSSLTRAGIDAVLNQPYSGKEGLMYAIDRHATAHGRACVELEVRQDLVVDPEFCAHLLNLLAEFFAS